MFVVAGDAQRRSQRCARVRKPKKKGKGIEKNTERLLVHSSWVDSGDNKGQVHRE